MGVVLRFCARVAASFVLPALIAGFASLQEARAGGFYTPYHSTSALGTALAGASARGDDPSFLFFNPASIAGTKGVTATADVRYFDPSVKISVDRAVSPSVTSTTPPFPLVPVDITAAGPSGEMADPVAAPSFYAAIPIAQNLTLGLSGSSPFAVVIDTDPNWAGRFQLTRTEMKTMEGSASLTYEVTPWLAVSGGVVVQKFTGEFEKSEILPVFIPNVGLNFLETTGFLKGEDWSAGAVAGILLTPGPNTRIGVGYRSAITHELKGTAGVLTLPAPVEQVRFDVDLPTVISAGIEQRVNENLRLFAEYQWVEWSRFKGFDISFASGMPNELRAQTWDDTWMVALGFGYKVTPNTEITAGVSYDTAVSDGGTNTLSPDANRTTVSAGLQHIVPNVGKVALQYSHVFFEDADININDPKTGILAGSFESSLDIVGLSLTMTW